jgi:hypothetical protein
MFVPDTVKQQAPDISPILAVFDRTSRYRFEGPEKALKNLLLGSGHVKTTCPAPLYTAAR